MTEHEILSIGDDADRADAVAAFLDRQQPNPGFLNALLKDNYDVIRAEALDCAITGQVRLDPATLRPLAESEESQLVRGRLKLYLLILGFKEEARLIDSRVFADAGKRDEVWDRACRYVSRRDGKSFLALSGLLLEDDYGVSETALDLMMLLLIGMHRRLLAGLLETVFHVAELKVSKARLDQARRLLAGEKLPMPGLAEIRLQLS